MIKSPIHVQLHSCYNVFDASGELPFSVVFGICRLQKSDTDPRSILIDTVGSVFDVPYALAHGLLTLYEERPGEARQWVEVDVSSLGEVDANNRGCISVPSRVHRTKSWRHDITVYLCAIDLQGVLASVLKPGKRYKIRLASRDLGVKKWTYSNQEDFADSDGDGEEVRLVNSWRHGNAAFKVVDDLKFPPRLVTSMCLVNDISLEITVVNSGSETVTVQSRGQQKFLVPWGPSATETNTLDGRRRIIDQSELNRLPTSSFLIVNAATGKMMHRQQTSICQLRHAKTDLRAKMDELVTLKPGIPLVNSFDIGRTLRSLENGRYIVRMRPKGCTWWCGELEKEEGEGDRVPARLWKGFTVPIMLASEDELDITIKDGKVDGKV